MIKQAIFKMVEENKKLTLKEIELVFEEIVIGRATSSQIGAFLTALRMV